MVESFIHWLLVAFGLMITAYLVPGIHIANVWAALLAAAVLGLLNILVWPILAVLTFPLTLITFGLFLLVLNGIVLKFGAALVPGFTIQGFLPAIIGAILLTIIGWLVRFVFMPSAY